MLFTVSHHGRLLANTGDHGIIRLWNFERAKPARKLHHDRPYERLNIPGSKGLAEVQKTTLRVRSAIEQQALCVSLPHAAGARHRH
jgi:hypothetical protein